MGLTNNGFKKTGAVKHAISVFYSVFLLVQIEHLFAQNILACIQLPVFSHNDETSFEYCYALNRRSKVELKDSFSVPLI